MPGKTSQSQSSNRGKDPKDSRDRLNSANQRYLANVIICMLYRATC